MKNYTQILKIYIEADILRKMNKKEYKAVMKWIRRTEFFVNDSVVKHLKSEGII